MRDFVVYHNTEKMGYELMSLTEGIPFYTRKGMRFLENTLDQHVWVITATQRAGGKRYYLVGHCIADKITDSDNPRFRLQILSRLVKQCTPPVELNRLAWFPKFLKSQGNFGFGFNEIQDPQVVAEFEALMKTTAVPGTAYLSLETRAIRDVSQVAVGGGERRQ